MDPSIYPALSLYLQKNIKIRSKFSAVSITKILFRTSWITSVRPLVGAKNLNPVYSSINHHKTTHCGPVAALYLPSIVVTEWLTVTVIIFETERPELRRERGNSFTWPRSTIHHEKREVAVYCLSFSGRKQKKNKQRSLLSCRQHSFGDTAWQVAPSSHLCSENCE